ncbi:MAG: hypothetical protein ACT4QE_14955, partial [Anaerolineales bacterium]
MDARSSLRSTSTGRWVLIWTITIVSIVLAAVIFALPFNTLGTLALRVGEPAAQDILAPRTVSYTSDFLTGIAREAAAAAVVDVYDAPDSRMARQQVLLLRDVLNYINAVRADALADPLQKRNDLLALHDVPLAPEVADRILRLDVNLWTAVSAEALSVLEQVMRSQVRGDQLEDVRRSVPVRVSVDISDEQSVAVVALVTPLITPNSLYNAGATQAARETARQSVEPITKTIVRGQAVLTRGRVVAAEDLEALRALGLLQPEFNWQIMASSVLAVLVTGALVVVYIRKFNPETGRSPKLVFLIGLLVNAFLLAAQLMVPNRVLMPYFLPAAALAMLLTVLAGPNLAITVAVAMGALVGYIGGSSL